MHSHRIAALLVASTALSGLAAAPALATEGPTTPPLPGLPGPIGPVTFAPLPVTAPSSADVIRDARVKPRRVRRGRRALLKVSLNTPSRLRIVIRRRSSGRRIRVIDVPAGARTILLRLPARSGGHDLRPGRYRISIVAIDAQQARSQPIRRTLIVRAAARRR